MRAQDRSISAALVHSGEDPRPGPAGSALRAGLGQLREKPTGKAGIAVGGASMASRRWLPLAAPSFGGAGALGAFLSRTGLGKDVQLSWENAPGTDTRGEPESGGRSAWFPR